MFGKTAVGIDGSSASRSAVEWATGRSAQPHTRIVLVHVASMAGRSSADTDRIVGAELEFAASVAVGAEPTLEVIEGDPVRSLAECASRFDLLVIGTHKTGFLRGRAFGSVGLRLASVIQIPLAVIPAPSGRRRDGVVVGIDDDLRTLPAVRMAAAAAASYGTELTVLHAQPTRNHSELGAALHLVGTEFPELTVHTRAVIGDASEVLINAAMSAQCLYIGGADPEGSGLGPVGYDVLLNISGPTILVPLDRAVMRTAH